MEATGTPNKMGLSELLNANLSKKMGLGMLGMYLVSETTDVYIALTIAGIALFGITAQTLIDWRKIADEMKLLCVRCERELKNHE